MAVNTRILLFGDQSEDVVSGLHQVLNDGNPLLLTFLEAAYTSLRSEISRFPQVSREVPGFVSVQDLVRKYTQLQSRHPALESALSFIYHIAGFLRLSGDLCESYPKADNTQLVGSCTGLLAAAAVSCSRTYLELVAVSTELLKVAFRVGVEVSTARHDFENASANAASWSAIFPGVAKEQASRSLEKFCDENKIPSTSRPYVSATSTGATTISGPSRTLDELIQSGSIKSHRPIRLPIYGPYHAPHLYNENVQTTFYDDLPEQAEDVWVPNIPIISNDNQTTYQARNLAELLKEIGQDILFRPLNWEKICDNTIAHTRNNNHQNCQVVPIGARNAANSIVNALKQRGKFSVSLDDQTFKSKLHHSPSPMGNGGRSKIAIVGMAGRFPHAANPAAFWDLLKQGLDVHEEIPKDRFDAQAHYDPTGKRKNTSHTPFGCFIEEPGLFDSRFFNMSPKEAKQTDPMHRLALLTAYEALEMSGYVPNRTPSTMSDRIGTFYGQTSDDWREIQDGQDIQTYFIPGGVRAFAPGRINYHFKFSGPSFSVDTACSSSLAAINIACNSLWQRDCDTAIAGGLNVLTNPDIFSGLSRGQFLSKTGNCKTFDDAADGYCRGDGAGTVILKRLEDAEADNDPILAVVLGIGTNHSAEAVSITHPHAGAQTYLFRKILSESNVEPEDVSYVEMHGTGTQAGDAIEMDSVLSSFAPEDRERKPDQPLFIGSVKSNVGHGEAASGITALAKILLMLEHNSIPPHCGIKGKINHNFPNFNARNVHISLGGSTTWKRPIDGKRTFFLNNFSAAGGNTSMLMEDPPLRIDSSSEDPRSTAVVAVSGKTKTTLLQNISNLLEYIDQNPDAPLSSLSYTSTARRIHYGYRSIAAGSDLSTIRAVLQKSLSTDISAVAPKSSVVFAFTGQGSHYTAMGKQLFDTVADFRSDILHFDLLAQRQGFPSVLPLIEGSVNIEQLSPVAVQVGATCIQMALVRLWQAWGVEPSAVIGHSLGEYAALYAADVLSANDTIFLTGTRAKLLETHCEKYTHAMLAVSANVEEIQQHIDPALEIACINGPNATVLSGTTESIDRIKETLTSQGKKVTRLNVPFAFHSAQVDPILQEFEAAAAGVTFNAPRIPVISPLLKSVVTTGNTINAAYLASHCRLAVDFYGGLQAAREEEVITDDTPFIEIGSHPICSGMLKATLGSKTVVVPSLRREEDVWKTLASSLCSLHMTGLSVNWNSYHQNFPQSQHCIRLPTYAWDATNYWIDYVNNWCLTKGDPQVPTTIQEAPVQSLSSSVQNILDEEFDGNRGKLTTETDIARPDLEETIKGHLVNGSALCSSSFYADMAFTIADYIHRKLDPDNDDFAMDCSGMVVDKPLIANTKADHQLLRTTTTADLAKGVCQMAIYSVNDEGKKTIDHAKCQIFFGDAKKWSLDFARQQHLVQSQLDRLVQGAEKGEIDRFRRNMAYKLFSVLVDYQDAYKGMSEVIMDSSRHEGTARVELPPVKNGEFFIAPYHIDSLCHLAGFIMNANDGLDPAKTVFVNHGWESIRFIEKPVEGATYWSYVRMQPTKPGSKDHAGDVYVCDDNGRLVCVIGGIEFQCLPKMVLDRVLPPPPGSKTSGSKPTAKPQAPAAKPVAKAAPSPQEAPSGPGILTQVLDVMAGEIGVSTKELNDPNELAALGVDSLMGLSISSKFREDLGLEVPSSLFTDCQTVKDVKTFFANQDPAPTPEPPASELSSSSSSSQASGTSTPSSADTAITADDDVEGSTLPTVLSVIAEETGVDRGEVASSTELANIGVDSLMSLQILSTLREDHGIDLSPSFFSDNQTVKDIENTIVGNSKPPSRKSSLQDAAPAAKSIDASRRASQERTVPVSISPDSPPATSVLLQGSPKTAAQTLFLFPDGSGSATSYAALPPVAPKDVAIVGLNCPFMKSPESFTCGIEGVAALYLAEVRRRQPHGPYVLGGWSAGGICAYEATLQLQAAGEVVEKLVFLDVPCPLPPQALPARLHEFFDTIGLLGPPGQAPSWLVPHFTSTIRALSNYHPRKMDPSKVHVPKVYTIMAEDGVCKKESDPRPELSRSDPPHMGWLLFNRTDFGPIGWENILGGTDNVVGLSPVPNVNHFTMMRQPGVEPVSGRIRQALEL